MYIENCKSYYIHYGEEIIQGIMDMPIDVDYDADDSCVLLNVSRKDAFQAIVTLNNYLLQHEKEYTKCTLQKIKDELEFDLGTKKKQMTLDAYFVKDLNWGCSFGV